MKRSGLFALLSVAALVSVTPASAAQQHDTAICAEVFAGPASGIRKEDDPPRYQTPAKDNGDGTYTLSYAVLLSRYLGSSEQADSVHDCAFVDRNGNSTYDSGETLVAVSDVPAQFGPGSSTTLKHRVQITIAAGPGDRICDRAQVETSYEGSFVDKTAYFCETLPGATQVPAGMVGGLVLAGLLGACLVTAQFISRRAKSGANADRAA